MIATLLTALRGYSRQDARASGVGFSRYLRVLFARYSIPYCFKQIERYVKSSHKVWLDF